MTAASLSMNDRALGSAAVTQADAVDRWPVAVFTANLLHTALYTYLYPQQRFDTDVLAYFAYFRNWLAGDTALHGIAYFPHPKALLVFSIGALGDASLALAMSALASAALGTIVYLLARDHFGRGVALATSAFLFLDISKAILTLRSGADMYVALFLFAAILLCERRRLIAAGVCLLLSALVKPVTLPCAACFLVLEWGDARRWIAAAIPLLAIPLIALSNHVLLGSLHGTDRFLAEFVALRDGDSVGAQSVIHFALWTQLVKHRFIATAAWGVVGLALWIGADRERLRSPLLLMPLLFLFGYLLIGFTSHFMPFFRFFWPLEVWFLMFVLYGAVETARRVAPQQRWLRATVVAAVALLLADNFINRQIDYRRDFALPFERSMRFADTATQVLREQRSPGQTVLTPLALLPHAMWQLPEIAHEQRLATAERMALEAAPLRPDWILYVAPLYASDAASAAVPRLIQDGHYEVRAGDTHMALLARPGLALPGASADR